MLSKLSNNSTVRILKLFLPPRRLHHLLLLSRTVMEYCIIYCCDVINKRSSLVFVSDRQRRGKQIRDKSTTTTTTTTPPTTTSMTTRRSRGQGGHRSRSRSENHHQGQQLIRHQHQLEWIDRDEADGNPSPQRCTRVLFLFPLISLFEKKHYTMPRRTESIIFLVRIEYHLQIYSSAILGNEDFFFKETKQTINNQHQHITRKQKETIAAFRLLFFF